MEKPSPCEIPAVNAVSTKEITEARKLDKDNYQAYRKRCSVILTAIPRLPSSCDSSRRTLPRIAAVEPEPFNSRTTRLICDFSLILWGTFKKRPEALRLMTWQSRLTISSSLSMPHTLAGNESVRRGLALRSRFPWLRNVETRG